MCHAGSAAQTLRLGSAGTVTMLPHFVASIQPVLSVSLFMWGFRLLFTHTDQFSEIRERERERERERGGGGGNPADEILLEYSKIKEGSFTYGAIVT